MATSEFVASAVAWLTTTGPPNWLFLVALLTSPWTWSRVARKRAQSLLGRVLDSRRGQAD